jgi:hypothetical protein
MIWYDTIWYDMIYDMIWYDMIHDIWYMIRYDMIYDMIHDIWYDMIRYDMIYMIWYDMIWYDMIYDMTWWYDTWYIIWYDIFVKCSWVDTQWQQYSTHLYANNTYKNTINLRRVQAVPRLCELYPGICLATEEKARKTLSQGSRRMRVGTMKTEYTKQNIYYYRNT